MPNEVLALIAKDLGDHDVLRLRLTCRVLGDVGLPVIAKRCTRIYLHPTNDSMKVFKEICLHPVFSRYINEIALLGYRLHESNTLSVDDYFDDYYRYSSDYPCTHDTEYINLSPAARKKIKVDFEEYCIIEREQHVAELNSADLMLLDWALDALPVVSKVPCIFQIDEHGLNVQSVWTSKIYQKNVAKPTHFKDFPLWAIYLRDSGGLDADALEFSDTTVSRFLDFLQSRSRAITSLRLGQSDAEGQGGISAALNDNAFHLEPNDGTIRPNFSLDHLLNLDICILDTAEVQKTRASQEQFWENLPNLQTLCVRFVLDVGAPWDDPGSVTHYTVFEVLLATSTFPHLKSVMFHNEDDITSPTYHGTDLCDFLIRHKKSLRQLTLIRMMPDECYNSTVEPIVSAWMDFLNTIRDSMNLENAVVRGLFGSLEDAPDLVEMVYKDAWPRIAKKCMIDWPEVDQRVVDKPWIEWETYHSVDFGSYLLRSH